MTIGTIRRSSFAMSFRSVILSTATAVPAFSTSSWDESAGDVTAASLDRVSRPNIVLTSRGFDSINQSTNH